MKKAYYVIIAIAVCFISAVSVGCIAWFRQSTLVDANVTGFMAETPKNIRVFSGDSEIVRPFDLSETGNLIPCAPTAAGYEYLKITNNWNIPRLFGNGNRFMESDRKSFSVSFYFSSNEDLDLNISSIVVTAVNSENAKDVALKNSLRYCVFLSTGDEDEGTVLCHSAYNYGGEAATLVIQKPCERFAYDWVNNPEITFVFWVDGFVFDYNDIVGGKVNVKVSFDGLTKEV